MSGGLRDKKLVPRLTIAFKSLNISKSKYDVIQNDAFESYSIYKYIYSRKGTMHMHTHAMYNRVQCTCV